MTSQVVTQFADALDRHDVRLVRTPPERFAETLADVVTEPAVGTPLPKPLDYEGTPVNPDPSVAAIEAAETGVTPCSLGIASYGSVVIQGSEDGEEPVSLFADHHVAVLQRDDLVPDMVSAIGEIGDAIRTGNGDNVIATGPSATADMGELVIGAHGPKRVIVVLVTESPSSETHEIDADETHANGTDADKTDTVETDTDETDTQKRGEDS